MLRTPETARTSLSFTGSGWRQGVCDRPIVPVAPTPDLRQQRPRIVVRIDDSASAQWRLLQPGERAKLLVSVAHHVRPAGNGTAIWAYVHSCGEGEMHRALQLLSAAGSAWAGG